MPIRQLVSFIRHLRRKLAMTKAYREGHLDFELLIEENDICQIYEGGVPSSICLDSRASDDWRPLNEMTKGHFHPVLFYQYHPQIGCACIRIKGTHEVLARAIVWRKSKTSKWSEFGYPYYSGRIFGQMLFEFLSNQDIRGADNRSNWTTQNFRIPGIKIDEKHDTFCPLPYLDDLSPMWCRYLKDTNEFEFSSSYSRGSYRVDGKSHVGYITASAPSMITPSRGDW